MGKVSRIYYIRMYYVRKRGLKLSMMTTLGTCPSHLSFFLWWHRVFAAACRLSPGMAGRAPLWLRVQASHRGGFSRGRLGSVRPASLVAVCGLSGNTLARALALRSGGTQACCPVPRSSLCLPALAGDFFGSWTTRGCAQLFDLTQEKLFPEEWLVGW